MVIYLIVVQCTIFVIILFCREQKKQQERLDALEEEAEIMTRKIEQKTIQQVN